MTAEDLAPLRSAGLTDTDILDAVQVIAYFNYINRVADALGIDLEPEMASGADLNRPPHRFP
jgi:alkylhydroperoxidase family enzyme